MSAQMHTMGVGEEIRDLNISKDPEPLESSNNMEEEPFKGELYDGDTDIGPTDVEEYTDDMGPGAIIASIHVDKESDDSEDIIVYMDSMTTLKPQLDKTITTNLLKSIKDEYKSRGSGIKP
jgi:hypothetical protein